MRTLIVSNLLLFLFIANTSHAAISLDPHVFAEGAAVHYTAFEYQGNREDRGNGYSFTAGVDFLQYFAIFAGYDQVSYVDKDYALNATAKAHNKYLSYGARVQFWHVFAFYRQGDNEWSYTECPINTGTGTIEFKGKGVGFHFPFLKHFGAVVTGEERTHGKKKNPSKYQLLTAGVRIRF